MDTVRSTPPLAGATILVTGAAGHLGRAVVSSLCKDGAEVITVDQDSLGLVDLWENLEKGAGIPTHNFVADLASQTERIELCSKVGAAVPRLDGIVHCAAYVGTSKADGWSVGFEDQSCESFEMAMSINLVAPFHLTQLLLPLLQESPIASVVTVASIYGLVGPDWRLYEGTQMANPAGYAASKGGLLQLTRWLATTLAPKVRVNSVSPGGIRRGQPASFVENYVRRTPLGRMASEEDIVGAISFLLSPGSSYITGENLAIDGGFTAW